MTQIFKSGFEALWQEWEEEVLSHPQGEKLVITEIAKIRQDHPDWNDTQIYRIAIASVWGKLNQSS